MNEKRLELFPAHILSRFDPNSKLKQYFDLLEAENRKINLVSRETSRSDIERLSAESLLPFEVIESKSFQSYLDIGSGGGFPAFPIIMCLGTKSSILVERTKKKVAALSRMAGKLNINVGVLDVNFEEVKFDRKFDLVTLRLVKLTDSLLKRIIGLLSASGVFLYFSKFEKTKVQLKITKSTYIYNVGADSVPRYFTIFSK